MKGTDNPNLNIWDKLKVTDPKFTKKINKGYGDITSIDPMWQIGKMTEKFGPCGKGWGFDVSYAYTDTYVAAEVKIVWKDQDDIWYKYGPISSMQKLSVGKTNRFDDEASKKAMTDALTKGLSYLGMSADVFLGLFENSKYVEKATAEYESKGKELKKDEP